MASAISRNRFGWLLLLALLFIPACGKTRTISEKQIKDAQLVGKPKNEILQMCGWPDFIGKNVDYKEKAGPPKVAAELLEYRRLIKDESGGYIFLEIYCDKEGKAVYYDLRPILVATELRKHPADAVHFNGHWYAYYPDKVPSWEEAKVRCQKMGGYLACVRGLGEQQLVLKLAGGQNAWLGGYNDSESKWFWITGEPIATFYWHPSQPNNGPSVYLQLIGKDWHDIGRNEQKAYSAGLICEWDD